jgi:hypothetical protein
MLPDPSMLQNFDWDSVVLEEVLANSYKDFHCKGLDYICLQRLPFLTVKAYFFEDRVVDLPEVVHPHDHRYDFTTEVMSGKLANHLYSTSPIQWSKHPSFPYRRYDWDTPLNGGNGFSGGEDELLWLASTYEYGPGRKYRMGYDDLHTIQILEPETCIVVFQYETKVPAGKPTSTYCVGDPPKLNNLYNRFTADQAVKRISLLQELVKGKK